MKSVFFSYSHKDEALRNQLETHLALLKRDGVISTWHDRRLTAGDHIDSGISAQLESADLILLLVSADFLASEYCIGNEMKRALERHHEGKARVIPIILRPCDWKTAPFNGLLALPKDGLPVTKWPDPDDAFLDIVTSIRAAAGPGKKMPAKSAASATAIILSEPPRSSNLRIRKTFTDRERDAFLEDAFEYMAKYFENSLKELSSRNTDIETRFRRIDANRFNAAVYHNGSALSRCKIRIGGITRGITYSHDDNASDNTFNESMSVEVNEHGMHLRSLGMQIKHNRRESNLGFEGASEYYWSLLIEPLQR
jgi:hypothetical protein